MHPVLFPIGSVWWAYALFCLLILGVLFWDLQGENARDSEKAQHQSLISVVFWIVLAMVFCVGLYAFCLWHFPSDPRLSGLDTKVLARQCSMEFLSGWLVEKSLSIDNLFVFLLLFESFAIPKQYHHRILFYGILGAILFRAIFISLGALVIRIPVVPLVFGVFLVFTGFKVAFAPTTISDPKKNFLYRFLLKVLPISPEFHGGKFLVKESGRLLGTPLLLTLIFIEVSDIIFAIDSVPAIFAITREPFIVFTSNIFAIVGLRALFFLLSGMLYKFHHLKYGLGIILCFVGLKMSLLDRHFDGHFPTTWSLSIILAALLLSGLLSWWFPAPHDSKAIKPHTDSL